MNRRPAAVTPAALAAAAALLAAAAPARAAAGGPLDLAHRHAVEVSPMAPMFRIYGAQYAYALDERSELIVGAYFMNMGAKRAAGASSPVADLFVTPNTRTRDVGTNHGYSAMLGYRRYLWRALHLEYQLWPAYNEF